MSASIDKRSPELSGLSAANSGFSIVEKAFAPASPRRGAASFWFTAAISLASLAAAAGITLAGDPPAMAEVEELPRAAAPVVALAAPAPAPAPAPVAALTPAAASGPATAPAAEERTSRAKNPRMLPVVLRGQPAKAGLGS
jgi:hypothetical protein